MSPKPTRPTRSSTQVTLQDVADTAGVSLATASRAINGSARVVRAELRDRVLAVAAELGYVSNGPAQALARSTTSMVGVIVHDIADPYYATIAASIMRVAYEHGLLVLLADTFRRPELVVEYTRRLRAERAKAVILGGSGFRSRKYQTAIAREAAALAAAGTTLVCVGDHLPLADAVKPDNRRGARQAAEYLCALGHREIGIIAGPPALMVSRTRLDAFRDAARSAGVSIPADRVVSGHFTREGGRLAALELLRRHPGLTAVAALNDLMAVGALTAIGEDLHLQVPGDVSVMGFDDLSAATDVAPRLTTVGLPLDQIGEAAMGLVLEPGRPEPRIVHMPAKLLVRESTGVPRTR